MARVRSNIFTKGLSGTVGGSMVFRSYGEETIVGVTPTITKEPTEKQKVVRERFLLATIYAKAALKDDSIRAQYQEKADTTVSKNSYLVAVTDFFHAPEIDDINLSEYTGAVGSTIKVRVWDDFKVEAVKVEIYNPEGTLVEQGTAQPMETGLHWEYTASQDNPQVTGSRVVIKATDMPGNLAEDEKLLN